MENPIHPPRSQPSNENDPRIVNGARCMWWDSIDKAAIAPMGLPCCPHCGGVLFETDTIDTWWRDVDAYEAKDHPGYRKFIEWLRGRCYPTQQLAMHEYMIHQLLQRVKPKKGDDV